MFSGKCKRIVAIIVAISLIAPNNVDVFNMGLIHAKELESEYVDGVEEALINNESEEETEVEEEALIINESEEEAETLINESEEETEAEEEALINNESEEEIEEETFVSDDEEGIKIEEDIADGELQEKEGEVFEEGALINDDSKEKIEEVEIDWETYEKTEKRCMECGEKNVVIVDESQKIYHCNSCGAIYTDKYQSIFDLIFSRLLDIIDNDKNDKKDKAAQSEIDNEKDKATQSEIDNEKDKATQSEIDNEKEENISTGSDAKKVVSTSSETEQETEETEETENEKVATESEADIEEIASASEVNEEIKTKKTKKVVRVDSITNVDEFSVATINVVNWKVDKIYLDENSSTIMGINDRYEDIKDKYLKKEVKVKVVSDTGEERILTVNADWNMSGYAFSETNDFEEVKIKEVDKIKDQLKEKEEFKTNYIEIENVSNIDKVVNNIVSEKSYEGCMTEELMSTMYKEFYDGQLERYENGLNEYIEKNKERDSEEILKEGFISKFYVDELKLFIKLYGDKFDEGIIEEEVEIEDEEEAEIEDIKEEQEANEEQEVKEDKEVKEENVVEGFTLTESSTPSDIISENEEILVTNDEELDVEDEQPSIEEELGMSQEKYDIIKERVEEMLNRQPKDVLVVTGESENSDKAVKTNENDENDENDVIKVVLTTKDGEVINPNDFREGVVITRKTSEELEEKERIEENSDNRENRSFLSMLFGSGETDESGAIENACDLSKEAREYGQSKNDMVIESAINYELDMEALSKAILNALSTEEGIDAEKDDAEELNILSFEGAKSINTVTVFGATLGGEDDEVLKHSVERDGVLESNKIEHCICGKPIHNNCVWYFSDVTNHTLETYDTAIADGYYLSKLPVFKYEGVVSKVYLTNDIIINEGLNIKSNSRLSICLNGHNITFGVNGRFMWDNDMVSGSLNICNCQKCATEISAVADNKHCLFETSNITIQSRYGKLADNKDYRIKINRDGSNVSDQVSIFERAYSSIENKKEEAVNVGDGYNKYAVYFGKTGQMYQFIEDDEEKAKEEGYVDERVFSDKNDGDFVVTKEYLDDGEFLYDQYKCDAYTNWTEFSNGAWDDASMFYVPTHLDTQKIDRENNIDFFPFDTDYESIDGTSNIDLVGGKKKNVSGGFFTRDAAKGIAWQHVAGVMNNQNIEKVKPLAFSLSNHSKLIKNKIFSQQRDEKAYAQTQHANIFAGHDEESVHYASTLTLDVDNRNYIYYDDEKNENTKYRVAEGRLDEINREYWHETFNHYDTIRNPNKTRKEFIIATDGQTKTEDNVRVVQVLGVPSTKMKVNGSNWQADWMTSNLSIGDDISARFINEQSKWSDDPSSKIEGAVDNTTGNKYYLYNDGSRLINVYFGDLNPEGRDYGEGPRDVRLHHALRYHPEVVAATKASKMSVGWMNFIESLPELILEAIDDFIIDPFTDINDAGYTGEKVEYDDDTGNMTKKVWQDGVLASEEVYDEKTGDYTVIRYNEYGVEASTTKRTYDEQTGEIKTTYTFENGETFTESENDGINREKFKTYDNLNLKTYVGSINESFDPSSGTVKSRISFDTPFGVDEESITAEFLNNKLKDLNALSSIGVNNFTDEEVERLKREGMVTHIAKDNTDLNILYDSDDNTIIIKKAKLLGGDSACCSADAVEVDEQNQVKTLKIIPIPVAPVPVESVLKDKKGNVYKEGYNYDIIPIEIPVRNGEGEIVCDEGGKVVTETIREPGDKFYRKINEYTVEDTYLYPLEGGIIVKKTVTRPIDKDENGNSYVGENCVVDIQQSKEKIEIKDGENRLSSFELVETKFDDLLNCEYDKVYYSREFVSVDKNGKYQKEIITDIRDEGVYWSKSILKGTSIDGVINIESLDIESTASFGLERKEFPDTKYYNHYSYGTNANGETIVRRSKSIRYDAQQKSEEIVKFSADSAMQKFGSDLKALPGDLKVNDYTIDHELKKIYSVEEEYDDNGKVIKSEVKIKEKVPYDLYELRQGRFENLSASNATNDQISFFMNNELNLQAIGDLIKFAGAIEDNHCKKVYFYRETSLSSDGNGYEEIHFGPFIFKTIRTASTERLVYSIEQDKNDFSNSEFGEEYNNALDTMYANFGEYTTLSYNICTKYFLDNGRSALAKNGYLYFSKGDGSQASTVYINYDKANRKLSIETFDDKGMHKNEYEYFDNNNITSYTNNTFPIKAYDVLTRDSGDILGVYFRPGFFQNLYGNGGYVKYNDVAINDYSLNMTNDDMMCIDFTKRIQGGQEDGQLANYNILVYNDSQKIIDNHGIGREFSLETIAKPGSEMYDSSMDSIMKYYFADTYKLSKEDVDKWKVILDEPLPAGNIKGHNNFYHSGAGKYYYDDGEGTYAYVPIVLIDRNEDNYNHFINKFFKHNNQCFNLQNVLIEGTYQNALLVDNGTYAYLKGVEINIDSKKSIMDVGSDNIKIESSVLRRKKYSESPIINLTPKCVDIKIIDSIIDGKIDEGTLKYADASVYGDKNVMFDADFLLLTDDPAGAEEYLNNHNIKVLLKDEARKVDLTRRVLYYNHFNRFGNTLPKINDPVKRFVTRDQDVDNPATSHRLKKEGEDINSEIDFLGVAARAGSEDDVYSYGVRGDVAESFGFDYDLENFAKETDFDSASVLEPIGYVCIPNYQVYMAGEDAEVIAEAEGEEVEENSEVTEEVDPNNWRNKYCKAPEFTIYDSRIFDMEFSHYGAYPLDSKVTIGGSVQIGDDAASGINFIDNSNRRINLWLDEKKPLQRDSKIFIKSLGTDWYEKGSYTILHNWTTETYEGPLSDYSKLFDIKKQSYELSRLNTALIIDHKEVMHNVTIDYNGGKYQGVGGYIQRVLEDDIFVLNDVPTKPGEEFYGWSINKDAVAGSNEYGEGSEVKIIEDITLYAIYGGVSYVTDLRLGTSKPIDGYVYTKEALEADNYIILKDSSGKWDLNSDAKGADIALGFKFSEYKDEAITDIFATRMKTGGNASIWKSLTINDMVYYPVLAGRAWGEGAQGYQADLNLDAKNGLDTLGFSYKDTETRIYLYYTKDKRAGSPIKANELKLTISKMHCGGKICDGKDIRPMGTDYKVSFNDARYERQTVGWRGTFKDDRGKCTWLAEGSSPTETADFNFGTSGYFTYLTMRGKNIKEEAEDEENVYIKDIKLLHSNEEKDYIKLINKGYTVKYDISTYGFKSKDNYAEKYADRIISYGGNLNYAYDDDYGDLYKNKIYLGYTTTKNKSEAITDIYALDEYNARGGINDSMVYDIVCSYDGVVNSEVCNVNNGAGGKKTYLYYTKDSRAGHPIKASEFALYNRYESDYAKDSYFDSNISDGDVKPQFVSSGYKGKTPVDLSGGVSYFSHLIYLKIRDAKYEERPETFSYVEDVPETGKIYYKDDLINGVLYLSGINTNDSYFGEYTENSYKNKDKIKAIVFERKVKFDANTGKELFSGFTNLISVSKFVNLDTTSARTMKGMFKDCANLTSLDLNAFRTSNVEDMSEMFMGCEKLLTLNLVSFDTSKVKDMSNMFKGCRSIKNLDITNFDTREVKYMNSMFEDCSEIESINLKTFNTKKVINAENIFGGCTLLKDIRIIPANVKEIIKKIPTPSEAACSHTDGKWYNFETKVGYNATEIPDGDSTLQIYDALPSYVIKYEKSVPEGLDIEKVSGEIGDTSCPKSYFEDEENYYLTLDKYTYENDLYVVAGWKPKYNKGNLNSSPILDEEPIIVRGNHIASEIIANGVDSFGGNEVTLVPVWVTNEEKWLEVTFNYNDGKVYNEDESRYDMTYTMAVPYNMEFTFDKAPEKDGYIFKGWSQSANAKNVEYEPNSTMVAVSDTIYYAVWEHEPVMLKLDYNGGVIGSETSYSEKVSVGKTFSIKKTPIKENLKYELLGWSTNKNATTATFMSNTQIICGEKEVTYFAIWKLREYKINAYKNDGSGSLYKTNVKAYYGDEIDLGNPTRSGGYEFIGWSTDYTGKDPKPKNPVIIRSDEPYYAIWEKVYTVTLDANDGKFSNYSSTIQYTKKQGQYIVLTAPTIKPDDNRTFLGWSVNTKTASDNGQEENAVVKGNNTIYCVNGDVKLYAVWQADYVYDMALYTDQSGMTYAGVCPSDGRASDWITLNYELNPKAKHNKRIVYKITHDKNKAITNVLVDSAGEKHTNSNHTIKFTGGNWSMAESSNSKWYQDTDSSTSVYYERIGNSKNCDLGEGTGSFGINLFKTKNKSQGNPIMVKDLRVEKVSSKIYDTKNYAQYWPEGTKSSDTKGKAGNLSRGCVDYRYLRLGGNRK